MKPRPHRLSNTIQHYAWGMQGQHAFIPQLLGIEAQADQTYAELWIGVHPKAPSCVVLAEQCIPLPDLIAQDADDILGEAARSWGTLPFLLKVLSAAQPLSIQAHPDLDQARRLHASDPEHYPDDNHKPEIAIALDSLVALVGFRPLAEIWHNLDQYPELARLSGPTRDLTRAALRRLYSTLMSQAITRPRALCAAIQQLRERLLRAEAPLSEQEEWFLRLYDTYPTDVGLFSVFLLNLIHLGPDQAIFIGPGIPHAYLQGNVVECMATSDNVVRAGLTPKFKDIETLVDILDYRAEGVSILGHSVSPTCRVYPAPAAEFQISAWDLAAGEEEHRALGRLPLILLVSQGTVRVGRQRLAAGHVQEFRPGQAVLIPACMEEFRLRALERAKIFWVTPGRRTSRPRA
jgi:mannose-6-phosphate isomerase